MDNLHLSFDKFTLQTQSAILTLHESQERVKQLRKESSLSGNQNVFDKLVVAKKSQNVVFGSRGQGIYQDSVLKDIDTKVQERTARLEDIIRARGKKEKVISGFLTIAAMLIILVLFTKTQKKKKNTYPQFYGGNHGASDNVI